MPPNVNPTALVTLDVLIFGIFSVRPAQNWGRSRGRFLKRGALLKTVNETGYHQMIIFITNDKSVQVRLQINEVKNVPCRTRGGVKIYFDRIKVVNIVSFSSFSTRFTKKSTSFLAGSLHWLVWPNWFDPHSTWFICSK